MCNDCLSTESCRIRNLNTVRDTLRCISLLCVFEDIRPDSITDARTPAFLQRLKGQYGGPGDRQNVQFARPKKQLIDAGDDEPTYVDEHGRETISKDDYEKMTSGEVDEDHGLSKGRTDEQLQPHEPTASENDDSGAANVAKPSKEPQATFGSSKKRKAVKVAGDEDETKDAIAESDPQARKPEDEVKSAVEKKSKPKKAKKVKLSFDED